MANLGTKAAQFMVRPFAVHPYDSVAAQFAGATIALIVLLSGAAIFKPSIIDTQKICIILGLYIVAMVRGEYERRLPYKEIERPVYEDSLSRQIARGLAVFGLAIVPGVLICLLLYSESGKMLARDYWVFGFLSRILS